MSQQGSNIYTSDIFSTIYYDKKSLKVLLEERSHIVSKLNLKPQRGDFTEIIESILLLFTEPPLELEPPNLLVLFQSGMYFIFFSTDYKYIPLCKLCNWSVYVTRYHKEGKIICCNPKCKRCVLEEFEVRKKVPLSMLENTKMKESKAQSKYSVKSQEKVELDKQHVLRAIQRILK